MQSLCHNSIAIVQCLTYKNEISTDMVNYYWTQVLLRVPYFDFFSSVFFCCISLTEVFLKKKSFL